MDKLSDQIRKLFGMLGDENKRFMAQSARGAIKPMIFLYDSCAMGTSREDAVEWKCLTVDKSSLQKSEVENPVEKSVVGKSSQT